MLMRARKLVADTYFYIKRHPQAWEYIESAAADDYRRYERMAIKRYMEMARQACKVTPSDGEEYGMANAMAPVFTRILVREHPEYMGCIRTAKSMVDDVFADERYIAFLEAETRAA